MVVDGKLRFGRERNQLFFVFKQAVYEQVKTYAEKGLPKRAETLRHALAQFYGTEDEIDLARFDVARI